ncbi:MAG: hypothetical protein R3D02_06835 [Hyphomicrobiales bacterium]
MLDLQADVNFHYRPLWAPEFEIFDKRRSKIEMADWYSLRDPRQLYYASYNIQRSQLVQAAEQQLAFVEKRNFLAGLDADWAAAVKAYLLPLRHYEWGANLNSLQMTHLGWGAAVTVPTCFESGDRLGMAQHISKIGLLFDENSGDSLDAAKDAWMGGAEWQGVRKMVEDSLVLDDWFEMFVAQNLAMDGMVYGLVYDQFDAVGAMKPGGMAVVMLTEFPKTWFGDHSRWVDAVIKGVVAESPANAALVSGWFADWSAKATEALRPLADKVLGAGGPAAVEAVASALAARAKKLGIA